MWSMESVSVINVERWIRMPKKLHHVLIFLNIKKNLEEQDDFLSERLCMYTYCRTNLELAYILVPRTA